MELAPAPIVRTDVLAALAVKVNVPVFTVSAVVKVALVTVLAVVALEAFPVSAPTKVVVLRVLVDGLKVKPVPKLNGWLPFVEEAKNAGK
jgi:hypothetical protein